MMSKKNKEDWKFKNLEDTYNSSIWWTKNMNENHKDKAQVQMKFDQRKNKDGMPRFILLFSM